MKAKPILAVLLNHLPWSASAAFLAAVVVRFLAVSGLNPETTKALMSSSSLVPLGLSVLAWVWPLLLLLAGIFALLAGFPGRWPPLAGWVTYGGLLVVAAVTINIFEFTLLLMLLPFALWMRRADFDRVESTKPFRRSSSENEQIKIGIRKLQDLYARSTAVGSSDRDTDGSAVNRDLEEELRALTRRIEAERNRNYVKLAVIALAPLFFWTLIGLSSSHMWLPAERIATEEKSVIGYVLSEGDWATVLQDAPRRVMHIRAETIRHRELCAHATHIPSAISLLIKTSAENAYVPCVSN